MYVYDGQRYEKKEDFPNLGSLVCTSWDEVPSDEENLQIRSYEGLSTDVDKLPKYDNLATGSSFLALDNGDFYKYERTTKTWYKL